MSNLTRQRPIKIGPYMQGEIPLPHEFVFEDYLGDPIDITAHTAVVTIAPADDPGKSVQRNAAVTDGAGGEVTYTWGPTDLAVAGSYVMIFWAGNGTRRLASPPHLFNVSSSTSSSTPSI